MDNTTIYFTICSNNYLAQAKVLGDSLKKQKAGACFFIFLCDELNTAIDYRLLADEVIPVAAIEPAVNELALKYDIVELNTVVKPTAIQFLFRERKAAFVIFLDPDIKIFNDLTGIENDLAAASILLTPHIYTPIPIDGKKPGENTFLTYGIYNLGFIGLRNDAETMKFLAWWKNHTYTQGFKNTAQGIYVDQLVVNLVPVFFKNVHFVQDPGVNMAPWNLHERYLTESEDHFTVNNTYPLQFFHFSAFITGTPELPQQHYNRFSLKDRPDVQKLYDQYNEELLSAGYAFYRQFTCAYSLQREKHLKKIQRRKFWPPKKWFSRR